MQTITLAINELPKDTAAHDWLKKNGWEFATGDEHPAYPCWKQEFEVRDDGYYRNGNFQFPDLKMATHDVNCYAKTQRDPVEVMTIADWLAC